MAKRYGEYNVPIEAWFRGQKLTGRIVEVKHTVRDVVVVELDSPWKGRSDIGFGFASAVLGHFVFDKEGNLTEHAIEGAQTALIWAYQRLLN